MKRRYVLIGLGMMAVIALVSTAIAASGDSGNGSSAQVAAKKGRRGPPGPKGPAGPAGAQGPPGPQGQQGPAGFSDTTVVTETETVAISSIETDSVTCPGSHPDVTGGGYEVTLNFEGVAQVIDSRPLGGGNGWAVRMANHGNSLVLPYTIWAICVQ